MKLKTPEFLQLYGTVHRQAFPQPFRFIRMCFNRRGLNRLFSIFCPDSNRLSTVEIRAFSVSVFQNVLCIRCRRQNKSFLIQQFFKNVGEVWASSPHLRSKSFLRLVTIMSRRQRKVFCSSNFSKMLARCGRAAHICGANCPCNKVFLLQSHSLKLSNS